MYLRLNEPLPRDRPLLSRLDGRGGAGGEALVPQSELVAITHTLDQNYEVSSASIAAASESMAM
jgi:hypothetical protein